MTRLFSYVVDHDLGFAPNPGARFCTLVHCKFGGRTGKRNIVELAKVGDWIIGTGGRSKNSAGHGRIIYLMRVDEKLLFENFLSDRRFRGRRDCIDRGHGNRFALVSRHYFYFGKNAFKLSKLPADLAKDIAKKGPGFRSDFPGARLKRLVKWFRTRFETGVHGDHCASTSKSIKPRLKCVSQS
jgi:hypothetical protein